MGITLGRRGGGSGSGGGGGSGGGSGAFGAILSQVNESLKGLFVYTSTSTPKWGLKTLQRQLEEPAVPAIVRFNNIDGDAYLDWKIPVDIYSTELTGNTWMPADLNGMAVVYADNSDFTEPVVGVRAEITSEDITFRAKATGAAANGIRILGQAGTPGRAAVAASLDYNDVTFRAATAGAAGNDLDVRITEGSPAITAIAAAAATAALNSVADGSGTDVVNVTWPSEDGADYNGRQVQAGPLRAAGTRASVTAYNRNNDRNTPAANAIDVEWYENGTDGNIASFSFVYDSTVAADGSNYDLFQDATNFSLQIQLNGTYTTQQIVDIINAYRSNGNQVFRASIPSTASGTSTAT